MEDGPRQLDMPEMPWTLRHPLSTRLTLEIAVYGTHSRVHKTSNLRFVGRFVHDLWMFNFGDRVRFLPLAVRNAQEGAESKEKTHYFLWREDTKLDLADFADGCRGIRELVAEHGARQERERDELLSKKGSSNEQRWSPGIDDDKQSRRRGGERGETSVVDVVEDKEVRTHHL